MFKFISQFKRPVLVVKAYKTDRDGDIKQEPIYVRFEDNVYTTDKEEIAKFIRNLKNFGSDYFEVNEIPADKGYQGSKTRIYSLDSEKDSRVKETSGEESKETSVEESKVNLLENKVNNLSNAVNELTGILGKFLSEQQKQSEVNKLEDKPKKEKKK